MSVRSEFVRLWNEFIANGKKISELTSLPSPVTAGDLLEVVRAGVNYKADGSQLPSGGGGGAVSSVFTRTGAVVAAANDYSADQITNIPTGNISQVDVQGALNELDSIKAPIDGPTFTGVPSAATAAPGTNTTQLATTAFVLANGGTTADASETVKGIVELATQAETNTGTDDVRAITPLKAATRYAPIASPTFTGAPAAPTAATNTDTTQVATTAFVNAEIAARAPKVIQVACSDEVTPVSTGTKATFRMPYAMTVTAVRASLTTAQASGSIFTVDIREAGTTILSTLITIDNTEKTSTTAVAAPVISDSALADDAEITIIITQIGNGSAVGLKVSIIGS